jgi:glutamyl-Q tRNA(Asp) synthetase
MTEISARPVFRFAPSPNGELHLGHAFSALTTARAAEEAGGRVLLRIEDIDRARSRETYIEAIFEDLAWLGLSWEEPVRRQSRHFTDYRKALAHLDELGLTYPCFASRGEISAACAPDAARDPDGTLLYPGLWRGAAPEAVEARRQQGAPFALRLDTPKALTLIMRRGDKLAFTELWHEPTGRIAADPARWGDIVIARKEVPTSFHLAVTVDDAIQGVTHVTRGSDLYQAAHVHRLLQALLDLPVPLYGHHRLIFDEEGRKLSKSARDTSLRSLREDGMSAAEIRRRLGF